MKILKCVDGSILWLFEDNERSALNLKKEAEKRGVDPSRIFFAKRAPLSEHLARQRVADLFLDTWPCNAHTTTSDALWAGLPVLTLPGESFASRVAASLVSAIGLPEMVTESVQDYEDFAVYLAGHSQEFLEIRKRLEKNRLNSALFNSKLFTKNLESLYSRLIEDQETALPTLC
jgi:predicted O-linked N-acetylglucosamine transferase (SPINDLY family)